MTLNPTEPHWPGVARFFFFFKKIATHDSEVLILVMKMGAVMQGSGTSKPSLPVEQEACVPPLAHKPILRAVDSSPSAVTGPKGSPQFSE